ncbi:MAG TPA: twin-arginine translocase TatA/TatE family subunit [Actinomycetes bacterium]|nr:twin-arginine translocase TatA/TatE family subunit [Actinomycetes bacterium]
MFHAHGRILERRPASPPVGGWWMFNVGIGIGIGIGIGGIFVILLVCLVVFGPEQPPETARKAGRLIGELLDIDAQLAELQRERQLLRAALEGQQERVPFRP